jgi:hypothetical protein
MASLGTSRASCSPEPRSTRRAAIACDRVAAGEALAECRNSRNSSEPHLHFQLMDHPSVLLAAGLSLRFDRYRVGDADRAGVPHNLEPFTASR